MSIETSLRVQDDEPVNVERQSMYVIGHELEAAKPTYLATDLYLTPKEDMLRDRGIAAAKVCSIEAGDKTFEVLDTRGLERISTPMLLVDENYSRVPGGDKSEYMGLRDGEYRTLGRRYEDSDRFHYPLSVSADHFTISFDEESERLTIIDLDSTNKTLVTGFARNVAEKRERTGRVRAIFTEDFGKHAVRNLAEHYGALEPDAPYGYYKNHPIIGRESPTVRNGVYGTSASECVVVDDKSDIVRRVTAGFIRNLKGDSPATLSYMSVAKMVEGYTSTVMRYDLDGVNSLSAPYYGNNGLIGMSEYINKGIGVCRHQALLAAHLIEEAVDQKMIKGEARVERNHDLEIKGAHAWAVYRPMRGTEIIVDPAQHFVGTRAQAKERGLWKYDVAAVDDRQQLR